MRVKSIRLNQIRIPLKIPFQHALNERKVAEALIVCVEEENGKVPFHIRPGAQRDGAAVFKGYRVADFEDVFQRWHPENAVTPSQPNESAPYSDSQAVTPGIDVTAQNPPKPAVDKGCNSVTAPEPPTDDNDDAEERAAIMSIEAVADAAHRAKDNEGTSE